MAFLTEILHFATRYSSPILLASSFVLGAGSSLVVARFRFREHLLDHPSHRSSHEVPTPRGGGIGILAAFVLASVTLRLPALFIAAVTLVSVVSLYGDLFRLSIKFRLVAQFAAAFLVLLPLTVNTAVLHDAWAPVLFVTILFLLALFLVGTANFYNFMDGINGIAGLTGVIAFSLLGGYTLVTAPIGASSQPFALLALCIALACLGFLPFNLPRARVFMGDVGSVMLGFLFAVLAVAMAESYGQMICFAALLFPFYADALTTMYIRLRAGESLLEPHRRHLYQVLVNEGGIDHWKVTAAYGILQLAVALAVLAACAKGVHVAIILLALCFAAFILVTYHVRKAVMETL